MVRRRGERRRGRPFGLIGVLLGSSVVAIAIFFAFASQRGNELPRGPEHSSTAAASAALRVHAGAHGVGTSSRHARVAPVLTTAPRRGETRALTLPPYDRFSKALTGVPIDPTSTTGLSIYYPQIGYGEESHITAAVYVLPGYGDSGDGYPQGTVTVKSTTSNHYLLCSGTLQQLGSTQSYLPCTVSTTALPVGTYSMVATYTPGSPSSSNGSYAYAASNSSGDPQSLKIYASAATTTTLQESQSTVGVGKETTMIFSGTVSGKPGGGDPVGNVIVRVGSQEACDTTLQYSNTLTNGDSASWSCNWEYYVYGGVGASPTPYSVTATFTPTPHSPSYKPTHGYAPSTATPVTLKVDQYSTTLQLQSSASQITVSAETELTYSGIVYGYPNEGWPHGTVHIKANGATFCTVATVRTPTPFESEIALYTCHPTAGALAASTSKYAITATFTVATPSSTVTGVQYATSITRFTQNRTLQVYSAYVNASLTPSVSSVVYGAETTVTFKVLVIGASGDGHPEGTVTVKTGSTTVCTTSSPVSTGSDTSTFKCKTTAKKLGAGGRTLSASYTAGTPSSTVAGVVYDSVTATHAFTVNKATESTTSAFTPSPSTVTYGAETTVTFKVVVTGQSGGGHPVGSVAVATGATTICQKASATSTGSDTATFKCKTTAKKLAASAGAYTLTATFTPTATNSSSTTNYTYSTSFGTHSLTVNYAEASTTSALTPSPASIAYGAETTVTFKVVVTGQTGDGHPVGSVAVTTGATTICQKASATSTGSDTATFKCKTSSKKLVASGTAYTLTATFTPTATSSSSTANYTYGASSGTHPLTVTKATETPTTTVTPSPASVSYGSETSVTFTVVVTGPVGDGHPLGSVAVTAGATSLCSSGTASSTGANTATYKCHSSATKLPASSSAYTVTATFTPTGAASSSTPNYVYKSGSGTHALTVNTEAEAATMTFVAATIVTYGKETRADFLVILSGKSGDGYPKGTVSVTTGTTTLCSTSTVHGAGSTAFFTCKIATGSALAPSRTPYSLTATYVPGTPSSSNTDYSYTGTTSQTGHLHQLTVTKAYEVPTAALSVSATSTVYGAETTVTFTVVVTGKAGDGYPIGIVGVHTMCAATTPVSTTSDSATFVCHATIGNALAASGTPYTITATFSGGTTSSSNPDYQYGVATATHSLTVDKATRSTATALTPSLSSVTYGAETTVTFTVVVTGQAGDGHPVGSVAVKTGSTTVCSKATATSTGSDTATFKCQTSAAELNASGTPYTLTATFSPTATGSSSTTNYTYTTSSGTHSLTVGKATKSTTAVLTPSLSSVSYGAETTITFQVVVTGQTGDGHPVGSIAVTTGATTVCTKSSATSTGTDTATFKCKTSSEKLNASGTPYTLTATFSPTATNSSSTGDFAYSTSSGTHALTVNKAAESTATALTPSPSSVAYAAETSVTFQVVVTGQAGDGHPVGSVAVKTGSTTVCTKSSATSTGTDTATFKCKTSARKLAASGSAYTLTATFTPTATSSSSTNNYAYGTSSGTHALTVNKATEATVTVLTPSPSSVAYAAETTVTFQVVVTGATGDGHPVGSIAVTTGATTVCTKSSATSTGTDTATFKCKTSSEKLPASATAHTLTASFTATAAASSSTSNFVYTSSTGTHTLTVTKATEATTSTLTPTTSSIPYGTETTVDFTVTVTGVSGDGSPAGSVDVKSGGITVCTKASATTTASFTATFTCSTSPEKLAASSTPYTLTATFTPTGSASSSSSNYSYTGSSGTHSLTVTKAVESTSTSLTPTPSSIHYGTETTVGFAVTVTGGSGEGHPVGSVTVSTGATTVCSKASPTSTGTDTASFKCFTTSEKLAASSTAYTLTAAFTPTGTASSSTSNYSYTGSSGTHALTVDKAVRATTTTLTVTPSSVPYASETAATIAVTVVGQSGAGFPIGTVTVKSGSTTVCSATLTTESSDSVHFSCSPTSEALAASATPYTLAATFTPNALISSSTLNYSYTGSSGTHSFTVDKAAKSTTTVLTPTPSSVSYGAETSVTFQVVVTGVTGDGHPVGSIAVKTGSTTVCSKASATSTGSDSATFICRTSSRELVASTTPYSLTATFTPTSSASSSSSNYSYTGSSGTHSLTVGKGPEATTTALTVTPASLAYGTETTATFQVLVTGVTGFGHPIGTVTVKAGATTVCTKSSSTSTGPDTATFHCTTTAGDLTALGSAYTLTATFTPGASSSSDASVDYATSSGTHAFTVTKAVESTTTTLTPSMSSAVYGTEAAVTFRVVVTGSALDGNPVGSVTVKTGSVTVCSKASATTAGSGTATFHCSTSSERLPAGGHTLTATFAPTSGGSSSSSNYTYTTSAGSHGFTVTLATAGTVSVLTPSVTTVDFGAEEAVVFTTVVTGVTSYGVPLGIVTVETGPTTVCSATAPSSTTADSATFRCSSVTGTKIGGGNHTLEAVFTPGGTSSSNTSVVYHSSTGTHLLNVVVPSSGGGATTVPPPPGSTLPKVTATTLLSGIITGGFTVNPGKSAFLNGGSIKGNVKLGSTSSFAANGGIIHGSVTSLGGTLSLMGTRVMGNVIITGNGKTHASVVYSSSKRKRVVYVCGAVISGNLIYEHGAVPADFGGTRRCRGNVVHGSIMVVSNKAAILIEHNAVSGNVTVKANAGGTLIGNTVGGFCSLSGDKPRVTGRGNKVAKANTCDAAH